MAKICDNCGKGSMRGSKVARARQELLYRVPKIFKPNLHSVKIKQADGSSIKKLLCTKCQRLFKQYMAENITPKPKAETS